MAMQLDAEQFTLLNAILAKTSKRLVAIHKAYREGRLTSRHVKETRAIRNSMSTMLAWFGDGEFYGAIEPDMVAMMSVFETDANALLCSFHGIDDARQMVA